MQRVLSVIRRNKGCQAHWAVIALAAAFLPLLGCAASTDQPTIPAQAPAPARVPAEPVQPPPAATPPEAAAPEQPAETASGTASGASSGASSGTAEPARSVDQVLDEALAKLMAQVAADPQNVHKQIAVADLLVELGRQSQAEQYLQRFCRDHPEQQDLARDHLFELLVRRAAWRELITTAAQAIEHHRDQATAIRTALSGRIPPPAAIELEQQLPSGRVLVDYLLGAVFADQDRPQAAIARLEAAVQADATFLPARLELAGVLLDQYRWSAVIELLDEWAQKEKHPGDARVESLLGQALVGLDQNETAVKHFQAAIQLNPNDTHSRRALARLAERTNDLLEAMRQYRALIEANSLDEQSLESLFHLALRTEDVEQATAIVDRLGQIGASPHRLARCTALLQNDRQAPDYEAVRQRVRQALADHGPDLASYLLLVSSYVDEHRYDEALAPLEKAVELAGDDTEVLTWQARVYRLTLQFDRSAEVLERLVTRYPNRISIRFGLIDVLLIERRLDDAIQQIRQALANPDLSTGAKLAFRQLLIEALNEAKRFEEQIALIESWQAEQPDNFQLWEWLIDAYRQGGGGQTDKALELASQLYQRHRGQDEARLIYLDLLLATDQTAIALQHLLDWLAEDPVSQGWLLVLIRTLRQTDRHQEALELVENGLVDTPQAIYLHEERARALGAAGRHQEAADVIKELIHLRNQGESQAAMLDLHWLQHALVGQLIEAKNYSGARNRLTRWIRDAQDPAVKAQYLRLLATCHLQQDQQDRALRTLERALELTPFDPGLNNDVAYHWADQGIRLDEALWRLRFAVAQEPRNEAYLDSLGWVRYKKGDFAEAIRWLSRAVAMASPADPVMLDHLGDACWRAGHKDEALKHWQAAVQQLSEPAKLPRPAMPEDEQVRQTAQAKVTAAQKGQEPPVAPLGQGIESTDRPTEVIARPVQS